MNSHTLWQNDIGPASDVSGSTLSDRMTDNSSNMPVMPKISVMRKNPLSTSLATNKRKSARISVRTRAQTKMANTQLSLVRYVILAISVAKIDFIFFMASLGVK